MADLVLTTSFEATAGTAEPANARFQVDVTYTGDLGDDFVRGLDDRALLARIGTEVAVLTGGRLDDIVGRATLENLASYLLFVLRDTGPRSIRAASRSTS